MKQICTTPTSSPGLVGGVGGGNSNPHHIFPVSANCSQVATPTLIPAKPTTASVPEVSPQTVPMQTPIFIIYAGQQQQQQQLSPKSLVGQLAGKMLFQGVNGQILNDATILQAAGPGMPLIGGNGVSLANSPQHIVLSQANGLMQQQKCDIPSRHFPTVINGQAVMQQAPPTIVNINGMTALLQPTGNNRPGPPTVLPMPTLVSRPNTNIGPMLSSAPLAQKRRSTPRSTPAHICISPNRVSERKKTPPPLVQVKEEEIKDTVIVTRTPEPENVIVSPQHHAPIINGHLAGAKMTPVTSLQDIALLKSHATLFKQTATSPIHVPPKTEFTRIIDTKPTLISTSATQVSLPYSPLMSEKRRDSSPQQQQQCAVLNTSSMPIYRFSSLNNVQPLQILTPLPPSCIPLPDFMKQENTTIAH